MNFQFSIFNFQKRFAIILVFVFSILYLVFSTNSVLAALPPVPGQPGALELERRQSIENKTKTTDLGQVIENQGFFQQDIGVFVSKGITAIISVAALLCLGYMLWGAIDWLTSEGDKDKYTSARNKILHAILGLAIVVTIWAVWQLILFFLGLNKIFGL